jgi:transposase-like protein
MSDEEARATFQRIRWADNDGQPYCHCGCLKVHAYKTRPLWKCSGCNYQFSVTSGTIFENRKRPVRDYLLAIALFTNGAKGISALQLSRDLNRQYKTAFVLAHKLREAIAAEQVSVTLSGTIAVDGACFAGHVKPKNKAEERVDRRVAEGARHHP